MTSPTCEPAARMTSIVRWLTERPDRILKIRHGCDRIILSIVDEGIPTLRGNSWWHCCNPNCDFDTEIEKLLAKYHERIAYLQSNSIDPWAF